MQVATSLRLAALARQWSTVVNAWVFCAMNE